MMTTSFLRDSGVTFSFSSLPFLTPPRSAWRSLTPLAGCAWGVVGILYS